MGPPSLLGSRYATSDLVWVDKKRKRLGPIFIRILSRTISSASSSPPSCIMENIGHQTPNAPAPCKKISYGDYSKPELLVQLATGTFAGPVEGSRENECLSWGCCLGVDSPLQSRRRFGKLPRSLNQMGGLVCDLEVEHLDDIFACSHCHHRQRQHDAE